MKGAVIVPSGQIDGLIKKSITSSASTKKLVQM